MNRFIKLTSNIIPIKKYRKLYREYLEGESNKKKLITSYILDYGYIISHAYAKYYNFGDNALAYGIKNIFSQYFDNKSRYIDIDVHSTIFDKSAIEKINETSNLLVVGGGGLIDNIISNVGLWLFTTKEKDIKNLNIPLIFYGIGYNNFANNELHTKTIKQLKYLKKKAISFTVRNDGTADRLRQYGLDFEEVADPGFFVNDNHPKPLINNDYIMLQIAFDNPKNRNIHYEKFLNNMISLCKFLISKNYTVVISPHCYPDIEISEEICKIINSPKVFVWNWFEIMRENNVCKGLGYYKYAKFVIAMRGHAQICPIGMGVPVISIINHPKHLGLLEKINQTDLSISVNDSTFLEKIKLLIEFVENHETEIREKNFKLYNKFENETKLKMKSIHGNIFNSL